MLYGGLVIHTKYNTDYKPIQCISKHSTEHNIKSRFIKIIKYKFLIITVYKTPEIIFFMNKFNVQDNSNSINFLGFYVDQILN